MDIMDKYVHTVGGGGERMGSVGILASYKFHFIRVHDILV